jgi:LysM repeat protein
MRRFTLLLLVCALVLLSGMNVLAQDAAAPTVHVVQAGENVFRISLNYGVTIAAIQQANNLANVNLIFVGQSLTIPGAGAVVPPPAAPSDPPAAPADPGAAPSTYAVAPGDTLSSIVRRFGTTYQAIATANSIANPNLISVGQILTIPGGTGAPIGPAQPTAPTVPGPSVSGFELGGQVDGFSQPDQMRLAGMTWVKRQFKWHGEAPSAVEGWIQHAHSNGFKILLSIAGDANLGGNPQQYYQNFAQFLGGVAALGPDAIEVWNEPNIDREWPHGQISGAAYTEMLRASFHAIRNANANVMVISAAPAPTGAEGAFPGGVVNDNTFIAQMAAAGAASVMDCLGIHYNEGIVPPDWTSGDPRDPSNHYTRYYPSMVSTYRSIFPSTPLCFTELGYLSPEGYGPLPANFAWAGGNTVQEQAVWLNGVVTQARNSRLVRLLIVWNVDFTRYDDDPMGGYAIIRPDNTCPACVTLGTAMQ